MSVYCPAESSNPLNVLLGYYSSGGPPTLRTEQKECELGFYCKFGERKSCPMGSYGNEAKLGFTGTGIEYNQPTIKPTRVPTNPRPTMNPSIISPTSPTGQPSRQPSAQPSGQPTRQPTGQPSASPVIVSEPELRPTVNPTPAPSIYKFGDNYYCSGLCAPGYFCPENSTSAMQQPCPGIIIIIPSSSLPPLLPISSSSSPSLSSLAGTFGAVQGLTSNLCSGPCPLGHYCPEATIDPIKCRAGIFGNTTGLIDEHCNSECWVGGCTDNFCKEGYFCPSGSVTSDQYECGDASVYCPSGSSIPIVAPPGYYTVGPFPIEDPRRRVDIRICEPGYFCKAGVKVQCPPGTYGSSSGLSTSSCSGLCDKGFYCPIGINYY